MQIVYGTPGARNAFSNSVGTTRGNGWGLACSKLAPMLTSLACIRKGGVADCSLTQSNIILSAPDRVLRENAALRDLAMLDAASGMREINNIDVTKVWKEAHSPKT
jgi:hypothetical protein